MCFLVTILKGSLLFAAASVALVAVYRLRANRGFDAQPSCGEGQLPSADSH